VNKNNDMYYIGKKKGTFIPDYHGSGIHIKCALKKYGRQTFNTYAIAWADSQQELNRKEKLHIRLYRALFGVNKLYNIAEGGDGGAIRFGRHTEETLNKMRKPHGPFSENAKRNMRLAAKTRVPVTNITREKHRKCMMNKENPAKCPEAREKDRIAHLGNQNVRGRVWMYQPELCVSSMVKSIEIEQRKFSGWVLGRLF
jgi:hypothetical protein